MRNIININDNWQFSKEFDVKDFINEPNNFEKVDLPHTYNAIDGQDGGNDYYRGECAYFKLLDDLKIGENECAYLEINGANSTSKIYFNGELLFTHFGGYSAFRVDLTNRIKEKNYLYVIVDNSPNDSVYPQMADFTFYGGLYRDVNLIVTNKSHFDLDYFGASGLKITPSVKDNVASIEVKAYLSNANTDEKIVYTLFDREKEIDKIEVTTADTKTNFTITSPHLWNGVKDPYLYKISATLVKKDTVIDNVSSNFGIRYFEINAKGGFILNGKSYPLRGVARHQDRPKIGNALKYEHHKEDIDLILEMGANTVRLAHYQHSQDFYNLCDEKGLVVWAEIPYISKHMENGRKNTISQMTELINQNYNHPSIVVWGLSNEITMNGVKNNDMFLNHIELNKLVHSLDTTRPTTVAAISTCPMSNKTATVSDVVSYNHYFGWYGGKVSMTKPWFDRYHMKYPNRAIGLSEYGAEALNWHTSKPKQGDYTEEYQAYYHEEMIKQIINCPYLWATHVWNMFDFAADARSEGGENGMNHKGLVSFDRKYKKDSFYAYKAWLSDEPFVHINSKRYVKRCEEKTKVTVYSNCNEIELYLNDKLVEKQNKGKYPFFYFTVDNIGKSKITAKSNELFDTAYIEKVDSFCEEYRMTEETEIINWFELETKDGYFSINDNIGDILKTFSGKIFALKMLFFAKSVMGNKDKENKDSGGMAFKIDKTMIEMVKGFSVKRLLSMAGGRVKKADIIKINKMLLKIPKKK